MRDLTQSMNVGNGTNNSENYEQQNIYGPSYVPPSWFGVPYRIEGDTLRFNNRLPEGSGIVTLEIQFWTGSQVISVKSFPMNLATHYVNPLIYFNPNTQKYDITYLLSESLRTSTLGAYPQGAFFVRDMTHNENIGNGTNNQDNYKEQNIYGPSFVSWFGPPYRIDGNTLRFNNRLPSGSGIVNLQIQFWNGSYSITVALFTVNV